MSPFTGNPGFFEMRPDVLFRYAQTNGRSAEFTMSYGCDMSTKAAHEENNKVLWLMSEATLIPTS